MTTNPISSLLEKLALVAGFAGLIVFVGGLLIGAYQLVGWWNHGILIDGDLATVTCFENGSYGDWYKTAAGAAELQYCHDKVIYDAAAEHQAHGARWLVSELLDLHIGAL